MLDNNTFREVFNPHSAKLKKISKYNSTELYS